MVAGHDVAAQAGVGEFPRERRGQAGLVEHGFDAQGDPAGDVVVREAGRFRLLLPYHRGQALRSGDRDGGGDAEGHIPLGNPRARADVLL